MADLNYISASAGRIFRALFELCLRRGWCAKAFVTANTGLFAVLEISIRDPLSEKKPIFSQPSTLDPRAQIRTA
eukprot:5980418-Pyramimonas_sp.AAC.1